MESMPIQELPNKIQEVSTSEDDETDSNTSSDENEEDSNPKLDSRPSQIIQGLDRKSSGYGSGLLPPPVEPIIPFEGDSSSSDEAQKKPIEKKWHIASINSDPIVNKSKNKPSESSSESSSEEDEEEESVPKTAKAYR